MIPAGVVLLFIGAAVLAHPGIGQNPELKDKALSTKDVLKDMLDVNKNVGGLLEDQLPGLTKFHMKSALAADRSEFDYPDESAPPVPVMMRERKLAASRLKAKNPPKKEKEKPNTKSVDKSALTISDFGKKNIPGKYLSIYKKAAKKYGVPWNLLAAIHRVETNFSNNLAVSSAGAIGPTQFMTCTWVGWGYSGCEGHGNAHIPEKILSDPDVIKKYGGYGVDADGDGKADPMDLEDAIFSTAHYLAANGGNAGDIKQAVFAYNHSSKYVADVMSHASRYVK
jgi:soluble lytic murein transglycosylase-like protein